MKPAWKAFLQHNGEWSDMDFMIVKEILEHQLTALVGIPGSEGDKLNHIYQFSHAHRTYIGRASECRKEKSVLAGPLQRFLEHMRTAVRYFQGLQLKREEQIRW